MSNKNIKCEDHNTRPASTLSYDQSDSAYCIAAGAGLGGILGGGFGAILTPIVCAAGVTTPLCVPFALIGLGAGFFGITGAGGGYKICHQDKFALIKQIKVELKKIHECPTGMHHFFSVVEEHSLVIVKCCYEDTKNADGSAETNQDQQETHTDL